MRISINQEWRVTSLSLNRIEKFQQIKGENMELYADIQKIKKDIDWTPKTSLNSGLDKNVNWYLKKWKIL